MFSRSRATPHSSSAKHAGCCCADVKAAFVPPVIQAYTINAEPAETVERVPKRFRAFVFSWPASGKTVQCAPSIDDTSFAAARQRVRDQHIDVTQLPIR